MRLDGFGLFVRDMGRMIRFYRDVLGFEIREDEDTSNVYLIKDGTLFLLYGRDDFERMTHRRYEYIKGLNGHSELALYVDTFQEVDEQFRRVVALGATPVLEPETEPWGQRTCYIADPVTHKKPGRQIPSGLCFCHGKISQTDRTASFRRRAFHR